MESQEEVSSTTSIGEREADFSLNLPDIVNFSNPSLSKKLDTANPVGAEKRESPQISPSQEEISLILSLGRNSSTLSLEEQNVPTSTVELSLEGLQRQNDVELSLDSSTSSYESAQTAPDSAQPEQELAQDEPDSLAQNVQSARTEEPVKDQVAAGGLFHIAPLRLQWSGTNTGKTTEVIPQGRNTSSTSGEVIKQVPSASVVEKTKRQGQGTNWDRVEDVTQQAISTSVAEKTMQQGQGANWDRVEEIMAQGKNFEMIEEIIGEDKNTYNAQEVFQKGKDNDRVEETMERDDNTYRAEEISPKVSKDNTACQVVQQASNSGKIEEVMKQGRRPSNSGKIEEVMKQGRRPFEVTLRGGTPWGFALNGGRGTDMPLYISKLVKGGKASESALMEGDYVLQINSLPCFDVGQALDVVDTAFNTLTLFVLRGQWNPPLSPVPTKSAGGVNRSQSFLVKSPPSSGGGQASPQYPGGARPRSSDDSVVFASSRSTSQLLAAGGGARPGKRRGESFNFGRLGSRREPLLNAAKRKSGPPTSFLAAASTSTGDSSTSSTALSPVWSSNEPSRSTSGAASVAAGAASLDHSLQATRPASGRMSEQWNAGASGSGMNRRRSDGYGLTGSGSSGSYHGRPEGLPSQYAQANQNQPYGYSHQQHRYRQQRAPGKPSNLQLMSMKSTPNLLTQAGSIETSSSNSQNVGGAVRGISAKPMSHNISASRSSPNIQAELKSPGLSLASAYRQDDHDKLKDMPKSPDYVNVSGSTPDLLRLLESGRQLNLYPPGDQLTPSTPSPPFAINTDFPNRQPHLSHSSHGLHRYQADYENITQPLRSEKISEISDIDEITGQDSLPTSPEYKRESFKTKDSSHSGDSGGRAPDGGAPTRDPMTLKYARVNQSHEKYPSWPVTQSGPVVSSTGENGSSRAQSLTDHTNTDNEFPKKQRLAYTPGLRPLAERNSPTSVASGADDNGKNARNASDPGFKKAEFVYGHMGRVVQKRDQDSMKEQPRFDDFYKNSQPGYPPPSMDSDGHNIGDKEYSAPSPPERDAEGVSERELNEQLAGYSPQYSQSRHAQQPQSRFSSGRDKARDVASPPTHLNLSPASARVDSSTSPMEVPSPSSSRLVPPEEASVLRPISHSQSQRVKSANIQDQNFGRQGVQRDRPSSYTANSQGGSKGVIVRSTPYYNTSTQTDMMPYAIKVSDPLEVASRLRNAQVQVSEVTSQTSPKSPPDSQEQQKFEEKSVQARLSKDYLDSGVGSSHQWMPTEDRLSNKSFGNTNSYSYLYAMPGMSGKSLLSQSSPFQGIKSIQEKYATDELPEESNKANNVSKKTPSETTFSRDDQGTIRSAFGDSSASILRKLSEEFYGKSGGQQRLMSASTMSHSSPPAAPDNQLPSPRSEQVVQQPGLREAESYSSVVIHHDQSVGPFGRDDEFGGSVSGESSYRNDSSVYSDVGGSAGSFQQPLRDAIGPSRSRRSLDPSYLNQQTRLHSKDGRVSSSTTSLAGHVKHHHKRELSAPITSSSLSLSQHAPSSPKQSNRRPHDLSLVSNSSGGSSNPKSSSSSHSASFSSNSAISPSATQSKAPLGMDEVAGKNTANMRPFTSKQESDAANRPSSRKGSDSVFIVDDDPNDDYEFYRKPSMRKAYGIYDETERLISQSSKVGGDKGKSTSSNSTKAESTTLESPTSSARGQRYSEGLGLIQEEGDNSGDAKSTANNRRWEQPGKNQKYAWQNEAWLRSRIDIPKGSNLKRTTSEQISMTRTGAGSGASPDQSKAGAAMTAASGDAQSKYSSQRNISADNYVNTRLAGGPKGPHGIDSTASTTNNAPPSTSQHSRTQSEDLSGGGRGAELKHMQQQALLNFYQRKTTGTTPSPSDASRQFLLGKDAVKSPDGKPTSFVYPSPDSSLYESIGGKSSGGGSPTESVAEIISKANENLAKSAQRVDSIRRSNSSLGRPHYQHHHHVPGEYMDMATRGHDRMRKETDWSRLRSSGSLRYSPDSSLGADVRRSNRSSFASENHYEDISLFSPSTPRGSVADSILDSAFSGASMDSGVASNNGGQSTYQNLPLSKRRPPPPPPHGGRDPSPEGPPPALPPRRYREPIDSGNFATTKSTSPTDHLGSSLGFEPTLDLPRSNAPTTSTSSSGLDKNNRIHVIPLGRHQQQQQQQNYHQKQDSNEDVEVVKRDFKSLMNQWENSSPREDRYAAELRKQAQKFSHPHQQQLSPKSLQNQQQQQQQQQQHANAIPMSLKHSRTPVNFSTTYMREPTLPQEATPPQTASPSLSSSISESTTISSSASSSTTTQPQHLQGEQERHLHHYVSTTPQSSSSPSLQLSSNSAPVTQTQSFSTNYNQQPLVSSPPPPQLPERTHLIYQKHHPLHHYQQQQQPPPPPPPQQQIEARLRSNSDVSPTNAPHSNSIGGQVAQPPTFGRHGDPLTSVSPPGSGGRDRSASDHDILSDRSSGRRRNISPHHQQNQSSDSASSDTGRRAEPPPPPPKPLVHGQQLQEDVVQEEFPPPPPEVLQAAEDEFAENSYIAHKNKSSRPIGSYTRSRSAAVLPSDNNVSAGSTSGYYFSRSISTGAGGSADGSDQLGDGGAGSSADAHGDFPSSHLVHQQGWKSEIALPSSSNDPALHSEDRTEHVSPHQQQSSPPARPARPTAHHIRNGSSGGLSTTPSSTKLSPHHSHPSSEVVPTGASQSRDSPSSVSRRQPPPLPDESSQERTSPGRQMDNSSLIPSASQFWPPPISSASNASVKDRPSNQFGNISPTHSSNNNNSKYRNSPSSSQANKDVPSPPRSPGEAPPLALPPRDYRRRDSAPNSSPAANSSTAPVGTTNSINSRPEYSDTDRRQSVPSTSASAGSNTSNTVSTTNGQQTGSSNQSALPLSPSHSRQPSQEELECDQQALVLAQHLVAGSQQGADRKLSELLRQDTDKKRMQFMGGLFASSGLQSRAPGGSTASSIVSTTSSSSTSSKSSSIDGVASRAHNGENGVDDFGRRGALPKEYWMSPSKAVLEMEWRRNEGLGKDIAKDVSSDGTSLVRQKEELLEKLQKKLEVLKDGKLSLQQEIADNDVLGTQVRLQVESRVQSRAERDKFSTFLDDLEKIVRLLLNLSGQLARAENAVQALSPDSDGKLRKLTLDKRERLYAKHEEAKLLKDDLDRRGQQVTAMLSERLLPGQLDDYGHYVKTRSQLTIELQEMEDKIALGREQMEALKKSIPEDTVKSETTLTDTLGESGVVTDSGL